MDGSGFDGLRFALIHGEPEELRLELEKERQALALIRSDLLTAQGSPLDGDILVAEHRDLMRRLSEEMMWDLAKAHTEPPVMQEDLVKFEILSHYSGTNWFCVTYNGHTILEHTIMSGNSNLVEVILDRCVQQPNAPLHPFKLRNNNPLIMALKQPVTFQTFRRMVEIMGKSMIDEVDKKSGVTPLMFLMQSKDVLLQDGTVIRNTDCLCEMLVRFGAYPMKECKRVTPFHFAAQKQNLQMARLFLKRLTARPPSEAQLNVKDSKGATVLHLVVRNGWFEIAEAFLGWGASVLTVDKNKECPLVNIVRSKTKKRQALVNAIIAQWKPQDIMRALSLDLAGDHSVLLESFVKTHAHEILIKEQQSQKELEILYQLAVNSQSLLAVTILKKHCKGLDSFQCELHAIIGDARSNFDFIKEVVRLGAKINSQDTTITNGGAHVIHRAIATASVEAVEFLLENGARLDVVDWQGNTPLHFACNVKNSTIKRELARLVASRAPELIDVANKDGHCPAKLNKSMKKLLAAIRSECQQKKDSEAVEAEPAVEQEVEKVAQEDPPVERKHPPETPPGSGPPSETPIKPKQEEAVEPLPKPVSVMEELVPASETKKNRDRKLQRAIERAKSLISDAKKLAKERQKMLENEGTDSDSEEVRAEIRGVVGEMVEGGLGEDGSDLDEEGAEMDEQQMDEIEEVGEGGGDFHYTLPDSLPWGMQITKEARDGWAEMDERNRRKVWKLLCQIGQGKWQIRGEGKATRFNFQDKQLQSIEMWKIKINKSGRIIFEICVDFDEDKGQYMDIVRVWVVTLIHRRYEKALLRIQTSYEHSGYILTKPKLVAVSPELPYSDRILKPRIPRQYKLIDSEKNRNNNPGNEKKQHVPCMEEAVDLMVPTNAGEDTFNLLKFHTIGTAMVKCILDGLGDRNVDFPFKVSPAEKEIIEMSPSSPKSIILVGRSGTGKTTCAVYRMWAQWLASQKHREDPYHQVFLTASATLKEQVEKTFRKLQAAVLSKDQLQHVIDLGKNAYPFRPFRDIPSAAFPLFLTTHQFLRMLDGTLQEPFFPRKEDGTLMHNGGDEILDDLDGMGLLVSLDECDSDDEFSGEAEMEEGEGENGEAGEKLHNSVKKSRQRVHLTYDIFKQEIWPRISNKGHFKDLTPSLVVQEIWSYIKGSSEALQCEEGHLSLEGYLKVGKKRAPNYSQDLREKVYEVFQEYKRVMKRKWLYHTTDLVGHIYRQIKKDGYNGTKIHNIFRDEVQDFTQAELLLDLRVASDPNCLFYCGDTCQTISRGVGFRFDDIRTLFFEEAELRKQKVGKPQIKSLLVNYRTHSGILNVACSIVDLLGNYFPQFMDQLPRESAFFRGPEPYLMENKNPQDILNLLIASGSASDSEVQFGAHQAILVRNKDGFENLPEIIQESALILTIPQAKGLEFDDVFIVDFFKDSPALGREWRVLMSYLKDKESEGDDLTPFDASELDKAMQGYLRCEKFDGNRHILLCEELKHLYTAVTRAKSNLVFFDSDPEKRAPFFHFLQRLGLAKLMTKAGSKDSTLVLSKPASKPEDWVARGKNFMDNRSFELALRCFESAKDPVWSLVAHAQVLIQKAAHEKSDKEKKRVYSEAGYKLMMACSNYERAIEVDGSTVKKWIMRASAAFSHSSEPLRSAAIYTQLDLPQRAKDMYIKAKEYGMAADICEKLGLLAEACKLHVCKNKKKKNYKEAFRILNGAHQVRLDGNTKQRIADTIFYGSQKNKDKEMMRSACQHMSGEKMRTLLSELGEWEILVEHMDPLEGAQLLVALGKHQEAVEKLGDENDFTEGDQWKTLLDCLLMIGTPEAFSRAYALCSRGLPCPLGLASKIKTTLAEATVFCQNGCKGDVQRMQHNLREAYSFFLDLENAVGQIECLSRLLTIGAMQGSPGGESQNELERLNVEVRPLCSAMVEIMTALLENTYSNVGTRALHHIERHFNIFGLSERKDRVSYRITNVRFLEALRQVGWTPETLPEKEKPTVARYANLKVCRAAIAVDLYSHVRVVFFNFLQLMHKGVAQRSADMNSKEMLNMKDGRSATLTLMEKERVGCLAKGLLICSTLRSIFLVTKWLPKEFSRSGWRMGADYKTFNNLCMERQWRGLLGAKWSGYSTTCSIKFSKQWILDAQKVCREVWKGSRDLHNVSTIIRSFYRDIPLVQAVMDPNLALWHMRRHLNLGDEGFGLIFGTMNDLSRAFPSQRREKNLDPVPGSDLKIDVRKQMWRTPNARFDNLNVDGHLLGYALKNFLQASGTAYKAFQDLNRFTGRCAYFESNMSPAERPRLCVEGFLELLEWQTVLLLPGFSEECVLPNHIITSMREAYNGRSISDYVFNHWQSMVPEREQRDLAKRELTKLVQMMWYFVNQVLPQSSAKPHRAVSMEQHFSRLLARRLPLHVCDIHLPEIPEVSDWTLPHVQNCKRAVALIACTLLAVATEASKKQDAFTMKFLPPLVTCVKKIDVPGKNVKVSKMLENATWTPAMLIKSLKDTCADLQIGIGTLTKNTEMGTVSAFHPWQTMLNEKAKLQHKKLYFTEKEVKQAKEARLYDIPHEYGLFIPPAAKENTPKVTRSKEAEAVSIIEEVWGEHLKFIKGVREKRGTKWHDGFLRWHRRAKASLRKSKTLSDIDASKEAGYGNFRDPSKRLKWVHVGLAFHPLCRDVCTVCPKGNDDLEAAAEGEGVAEEAKKPTRVSCGKHDESKEHLEHLEAFKKYENVQAHVAKLMERLASFEAEVEEVKKIASDDPDVGVRLMEMSRELSPEKLKKSCMAREEARVWTNRESLKDLIYELKNQLKKCEEELNSIEEERKQEESKEDGMDPDMDYHDEDDQEGDFTVVGKKKKKKGKKKNRHMEKNEKRKGSKR
ncbi:hypothetical protein BSKO_09142 [Bryopsis sp. KO-2023]|nr:hypothetical protein BSKO_09142 [Bryopsis sp. KO-2023]